MSTARQQVKLEAHATIKHWVPRELIRAEGHSAKHLKRSGLEHLLVPVEARRVEVFTVYKLDQPTWSVADLDKLMKLFERKGAALVSLGVKVAGTPPATLAGRWLGNTVRRSLLRTSSKHARRVV